MYTIWCRDPKGRFVKIEGEDLLTMQRIWDSLKSDGTDMASARP